MFRDFTNLGIKQNTLDQDIVPYYQGVVVACSGGADSTALFHILCQIAKQEKKFPLALAHIHYGLRGAESEGDFDFVSKLAADFDVPFFARRVSAAEREQRQGESLQEWARRLRYEEFARLAGQGWAVALAHHLDDLAETVLMRLARGTAPETLLGMHVWRAPYWRPLLSARKAAILELLDRHGWAYREDASNARLDYSRNILRHKVLPELEALFPGAATRIVACAAEAAEAAKETPAESADLTIKARLELARFVRLQAPRAPLSRRWLDAAARRLASGAPRAGALGPELPGTALRVTRGTAGRLEVTPQSLGLKAERHRQHEPGIHGASLPAALLEPHSHAVFRRGEEEWAFSAHLAQRPLHEHHSLRPVHLQVFPTKLDKRLRFQGISKECAARSLLDGAGIPPAQRRRWLLLRRNGESLGLYDGGQEPEPRLLPD